MKKIFFLILCSVQLFSQNEAQKWYFGDFAGLDFATNPPTILTNGMLTTFEGCASISNGAGNLLFYTDGIDIYNQTHALMANGTGLFGDGSSTQSGVIVKQPGNSNIYYVFTQDDVGDINGFRYSIVDMNLAAGMGSVTIKNTLLHTPSCEKITAVRHCNGVDVWVVSHDWNSGDFRTYLVSASGISSSPVISTIGTMMTGNASNTIGQMKISPNGRKLGLAIWDPADTATCELYDFDASTGVVSNSLVLIRTTDLYGCEFSPDGSKFYAGTFSSGLIMQWNLCAGNNAAVINSLYTITTINHPVGSLQLAPNSKIYVARAGASSLSVIDNPNGTGAACNFLPTGQSVAPELSQAGLPNFINSFFRTPPPPFTFTANCASASFTAPVLTPSNTNCTSASSSVTGISWNFGDPSSGSANISTLNNPSHQYSSQGTFVAKLIIYYPCATDTIKQTLVIAGVSPTVVVTGAMNVCAGDRRFYTAAGATSYSWSSTNTNTTSVPITHTATAVYTVTGNGSNGCNGTTIFTVTVHKCLDLITNEEHNNIKIFPNPFNETLNIETDEAVMISIIDQFGSVVYESKVQSGLTKSDVGFLPAGMYTVIAKGKKTVRFKMLRIKN